MTAVRRLGLKTGEVRALPGSGGTGGMAERDGVLGGECAIETEVVRRCVGVLGGESEADCSLGEAEGSRLERVRRRRVG